MSKRTRDALESQDSSYKKHKESHSFKIDNHRKNSRGKRESDHEQSTKVNIAKAVDHEDAFRMLPRADSVKAQVPAYTPFTVAKDLPPLPEINDPKLVESPFLHKSYGYDRTSTNSDLTYERLEFLGDAYLELFASRLIFHHFSSLPAGSQSQVRELLVKNETLSEYARRYGFESKVKVADLEHMLRDAKDRGNKGLNKILADVFEAYIAAIIISDPEHGFARAETWLTTLWAPKLNEAALSQKYSNSSLALQTAEDADPRVTYSPTAKADLQKRIQAYDAKLVYAPYKASIELKGDQLGQNRHFIALHLTGYGYENKLLGRGEGKNKVEAGNWAAMEAMHGECRGVVDECEKRLNEMKAQKKAEREARDLAAGGGN